MAGTFFMLMATVGLNNILDDASKYSIDSKLFNKINRKEVKLSATKPGIFIIKENDNQIDTATAKTINYKIFTIHSIKYNSNITPSIFLIIFGVGMLIISTVGTTMDIKGKMKDISLLKLLDIIKK